MDEVSALLNMEGKGAPEKSEAPTVVLMVDGEEISDPKEIATYVLENMSEDLELAQNEELKEAMPMKGMKPTMKKEEEAEYVPGVSQPYV